MESFQWFSTTKVTVIFFLFILQLNGATYKSETKFSGGGVGRNIAEGLEKLNGAVSLISAFGRDQNGDFLRKTLSESTTHGSKISDTSPTANCAVILDRQGDCKLVVGDMTIHQEITPDLVSEMFLKKVQNLIQTVFV
jgi:pseudouridylate synthase / pseudouridine kinase